MNDNEIVIEAYTHSFCRRFDKKVLAIVHDNVKNNIDAAFSKPDKSSLSRPHYTTTCKRSISLVSKLLLNSRS